MNNTIKTLLGLGTLGFGAFALTANMSPMSTPVVPVLSQLTPVFAEVTQFGQSQMKFVSHADFVFMNQAREAALEEIEEIFEQAQNDIDEAFEDFENDIDEAFSPVTPVAPVTPPVVTPSTSQVCFSTVYKGSVGDESEAFGCEVSNPQPGYVNVLWEDGVSTTFVNWDGPNDQLIVDGKTYTGEIDYVWFEGNKYLHFSSDNGSENWIPTSNFRF